MLKNSILIFLFTILVTSVWAQDVTWGPELRQSTKNRIERIIGEDQNGIYVSRMKSKFFGVDVPVVEHYNKKMVLKYATPLKELAKRNISVDNFWHFNNKLFVYFTNYNSRKRTQTLYYQEVDKKTGRLKGRPEALAGVSSYSYRLVGQLEYAAAIDSSTAAIYYSPYIETGLFQRKQKATFQLQVVDKDFNTLWNKNVTAPYDYDLFDVEKIEVDRKGNAYVLVRVYNKSRRERRGGKANYFYKVLAYSDNGETLKEYNLTLDGLFINEITFKVNSKSELTCAGFYSERSTRSIKGSFFFTIDIATEQIVSKGNKPFDKQFLSKLMSKRRARKGKELYRYYLDEIILRSDGGAVLIGEQYYVVTSTYYTGVGLNRTANTTYTYHHEDIIVININPDASIAWATNIPKNQSSSTTAFSSYSHAIVKGKIHFIFNERISRRAPVMHASVNTRGEVDIKELFNNREEGILTRPLLCRQTSKDEMIIFGERGKRYKFGKIKF